MSGYLRSPRSGAFFIWISCARQSKQASECHVHQPGPARARSCFDPNIRTQAQCPCCCVIYSLLPGAKWPESGPLETPWPIYFHSTTTTTDVDIDDYYCVITQLSLRPLGPNRARQCRVLFICPKLKKWPLPCLHDWGNCIHFLAG